MIVRAQFPDLYGAKAKGGTMSKKGKGPKGPAKTNKGGSSPLPPDLWKTPKR